MYVDSGGGHPDEPLRSGSLCVPRDRILDGRTLQTFRCRRVVFSEDVDEADSHGATLTKHAAAISGSPTAAATPCCVVDTATDAS